MNKKRLSLSMIVPLAAAGAVSSAPGASAQSGLNSYQHRDRVWCDLDARALRYADRIWVNFTLDTNRNRDRGYWRVDLRHNGRLVETDWRQTNNGRLRIVNYVRDRYGSDRFTAYAYNPRTGQRCWASDTVRYWDRDRDRDRDRG